MCMAWHHLPFFFRPAYFYLFCSVPGVNLCLSLDSSYAAYLISMLRCYSVLVVAMRISGNGNGTRSSLQLRYEMPWSSKKIRYFSFPYFQQHERVPQCLR
ncbi:hypothetical protein CABS01_09364 [Colletotrichum abscissum]|uniref:uncharacterized protein n=1 Tax=Colletotrichum abscissum TaxID=1671311 RepID=UPI0027D4B813|nr:uncharacterized protein CABS01_09364 [Colletotrichum abscissum]KAK1502753.1 hypothetical protein CABS01_09364 [Colletotrichum abscissum]